MSAEVLKKKVSAKAPSSDFTPEEYFLWSRIQGEVEVSDLLKLCPWPQDQALKVLLEVIKKGSSIWVVSDEKELLAGRAKPASESLSEDEPSFVIDLIEQEEKDPQIKALDREWRLDIRLRSKIPETASPFEILDLRAEASEHEIKLRYFELSRKFHPDRHFRKDLKAYRELLNTVFSRIQKAYGVLKDPINREAESRRFKLKNSVPAKEKGKKPSGKLAPELEAWARAEAQYKEGLKLSEAGQHVSALSHFQMAMNLNPGRSQYQKAIDEVAPLAKRERGVKAFENAKVAIKANQWDEVFRMVKECLSLVPDHPEAQSLFGRCVMDSEIKSEYRRAKEFLLRAKAQLPKDPDPCVSLAKYFISEGDTKAAKREIEEALKRDASYARALKLKEQI